MKQKLCFVRRGFKKLPRGVAYREGLFQPRSKGSKRGGVSGGGGVKVSAK